MCVEVRSSGSLGAVRLQLGMQVALLRRPATLVRAIDRCLRGFTWQDS